MRIEGLSFKGWQRKNGDLDQLRFLEKFTLKNVFITKFNEVNEKITFSVTFIYKNLYYDHR